MLCNVFIFCRPKVDKQYSRDTFLFQFALLLVISVIFTITKNSDRLINRDQTEEWKGWMQVTNYIEAMKFPLPCLAINCMSRYNN